jgi:alpha-tubulin suppressor-like RCC1 family protein
MRPSVRPLAFASSALLLAACSEPTRPPEAAAPDLPGATLAVLRCNASVAARTLRCDAEPPAEGGGSRAVLIFGGQGRYVQLTSGEASYDGGTQIFHATVSVRNLMGQPIGTADGATPDAEGTRVFFHSGPTATGGSGTITVNNPDGSGDFTGTDQPFFRYPGILTTDLPSLSQDWRFNVPGTVTTFSFVVYVVAEVPHQTALQQIDFDPRSVAAGGFHSCALTTAGQAYCWGANDDGQLGSASTDSVPVPVAGGLTWASLSAGRFHSCGVTTGGTGYCWGDNQTGQLGDGGVADSPAPVPVAGGLVWKQIDAGAGHSCGVTTSLVAYCWGDGAAGQLGNGVGPDSSNVPVAVQGSRLWASVSAGSDHSCGVSRGGAAYCWGDNGGGEMGTGFPGVSSPQLVAGNLSWKSVSAGENFSCGVSSTGKGFCWGQDSSDQLGNAAAGSAAVPDSVRGGYLWRVISTGRETSCGVTVSGAGLCWGFNNTGEIGDGTTAFSDIPVPVSGGYSWRWIYGGDYHTCGIRTSGEARCWGYNEFGQIGNQTTDNNPFPTLVFGGYSWAQ